MNQSLGAGVKPPPLPTSGLVPPAAAESGWSKLGTLIGGAAGKTRIILLAAQGAKTAFEGFVAIAEPFIKLNSEMENTQLRFKVLLVIWLRLK